MEQLYALCDRFAGSSVSETWRSLLDLYQEIERETEAFQDAFNVHCPGGCGTCCERFIPDLSVAEASLVAAYLMLVKEDKRPLDRILGDETKESTACPLYDPDTMFHCTVYPVRGMICRLFGACPSEDKGGHPVFRRCKYHPDPGSPAVITAADFVASSIDVPTMQRFAMRFSAVDRGTGTLTIREAISREFNRLQFLAACIDSGSNDDDNGGSDPIIPTPQAS